MNNLHLRYRNSKSSKMESYKINSRSKVTPNPFLMMKKSERIAWIIVCFQFLVILSNRHSWSSSSSPSTSTINSTGSNIRGSPESKLTTTNKFIMMNDHTQDHYDKIKSIHESTQKPFYDSAVIYPESSGLVSREWHSNGFPSVNPNLQKGSCWCGADEWYVLI